MPRRSRCPSCGRPGDGHPCAPHCPSARHPTPGETAYVAYCRDLYGTVIVPWRVVLPASTCAWEAAAQAAIAWHAQQAAWAQTFRCDCDLSHRVPVGALCAACDSLKSIADAAQAVRTQALAARVWDRQAPSSRWQVVPPAGEEAPHA